MAPTFALARIARGKSQACKAFGTRSFMGSKAAEGKAIFEGTRVERVGCEAREGPLKGHVVAVKDLFDVAGLPTTFGNPTWEKTHEQPAQRTAAAVEALLGAGAAFGGKANLDELAFSLQGENVHYGTPRNPAAPGRVPGGSSSGSASAVASGECTIGLGSDTAGSIRVPASFCSLFGYRPTHGAISLEGARPLAPSFDDAGIMTRRADDLLAAAEVLLNGSAGGNHLRRCILATDAMRVAESSAYRALEERLDRGKVAEALGEEPREEAMAAGCGEGLDTLEEWMDCFRRCQPEEVWRTHGEWVRRHEPELGPGIRSRLEAASQADPKDADEARGRRKTVSRHLESLLGDDGVALLPTAPGPPPEKGLPEDDVAAFRAKAIQLTCPAGLAGLPQVTIPIAATDEGPLGLSLLGPRHSDLPLLRLASRLASSLS